MNKKSEHKEWRKEKYLLEQIDLIRQLEGLNGFAYFSSKHFFRDDLSRLNKKLQKKHCRAPALVPEMPWIDSQAPLPPSDLRIEGDELVWEAGEFSEEWDRSRFFTVYRFYPGENSLIKNSENLIELTGARRISFEDGIPAGIYRVAALDRLNNESQLSKALVVD
jgi:hypothetical protein